LRIIEPQSSPDGSVGDSYIALSQGGSRRLDIDTILDFLDHPFKELEILQRD
jgi:hypothetical protein